MLTTTPRRKPCEGQVPTPTIFIFPSRSNSPTRTQIFVVPTSIPTITRSCTIHAPLGGCKGTSCDACALRTSSLQYLCRCLTRQRSHFFASCLSCRLVAKLCWQDGFQSSLAAF